MSTHIGNPDGTWTDISEFVRKVEFESPAQAETNWSERVAGLQQASMEMTFDNSAAAFHALEPLVFPAPRHDIQISYEVPASRWQRIKHWLKNHGMRWLKVRYVAYTTVVQGVQLESWENGMMRFAAKRAIERSEHRD